MPNRNCGRCWSGPPTPGPPTPGTPTRATAQVLTELIESAERQLVAMTYAARPHPPLLDALSHAVGRGVGVDIVVETLAGARGCSRANEPGRAFASIDGVRLWQWPKDRRTEPGARQHAKLAKADARPLLTSANLTAAGVLRNIEAGVVISGGSLPARMAEHVPRAPAPGHHAPLGSLTHGPALRSAEALGALRDIQRHCVREPLEHPHTSGARRAKTSGGKEGRSSSLASASWMPSISFSLFSSSLRSATSSNGGRIRRCWKTTYGVRVATMHRMKGLEFRCVAVTGVNGATLTLPRALTSPDIDPQQHREDLLSELSLLFVACTRPREALYLLWHRAPGTFLSPTPTQ